MGSRFAVQEVGGSGARDFCFLGYLWKAFHRLVGTIQSTVPGQGTRIPVSRLYLLLIGDAGHLRRIGKSPPRRWGIHDAADQNSVRHIPQSTTTQPIKFQNLKGVECLSTAANNIVNVRLEGEQLNSLRTQVLLKINVCGLQLRSHYMPPKSLHSRLE